MMNEVLRKLDKKLDEDSQDGEVYRSIETMEEDAYYKGKFDGLQQARKRVQELM